MKCQSFIYIRVPYITTVFAFQILVHLVQEIQDFPLPGNMNIDVNMHCETLQMPENQQSLASAFLDIETAEMKKHQVLAQFMHNTRVDDNKKAKLTNQNNSKEVFESAKVHVLYTYMILRVLQLQ